MKSCMQCRYYKALNDDIRGQCHRYPPNHFMDGRLLALHPLVPQDDWCGEFRERENEGA